MKTLTQVERLGLEALIDRVGLTATAAALAAISSDKAHHLRDNWQDPTSARHWDEASTQFSTIERYARNALG